MSYEVECLELEHSNTFKLNPGDQMALITPSDKGIDVWIFRYKGEIIELPK